MTANLASKRPSHRAYIVKDGQDTSHWTEIGSAWRHKDGKGFSIEIDAIPLTGRIIFREIAGDSTGEEVQS